MNASPRDPLLIAARFVLVASIAITALTGAAMLLAVPALLAGGDVVLEHLRAAGAKVGPEFVSTAAGALFILSVLMAGGTCFLILLRRIVLSVGEGDPFNPVNAERLARMGWIALGSQVAMVPLGAMLHWIAFVTREARSIRVEADFSFSGGMILLTLVLFILARVFRQGALMREELEGTV